MMARSRKRGVSGLLLAATALLAVTLDLRPAAAADASVTVAKDVTLPYPAGWSVAPPPYANVQELINVPLNAQASLSAAAATVSPHILISTEPRINHAEAVSRLKELGADSTSAPTFLKICGWPALQRRALVPQPQRGELDSVHETPELLLRLVTAVAVDSVMVRIEGSLMPDSAPAIADQVEAIARGLVCKTQGDPSQVDSEINSLRNSWSSPSRHGFIDHVYRFVARLLTPSPAYAALLPRRLPIATEMEVAVSSDGEDIVVCGQNTYRTSNDGGVTFPFSGAMPLTTDGDCSLAIGQSGNFYGANLVNGSGTGVLFDTSTDSGRTFTNLSRAETCPGTSGCNPDQEHIAADRVTAGSPGDQVYVVWRNFNTSGQDPTLVCSQDGLTWTNPPIDVEVGGFVPRITVGQDGFVYVIYRTISGGGGNIRISKYSSCKTGLTLQPGFPRTVTAVTDVTCPVPGLDRCNLGGNILSSHLAAVDDTNPNHIYVSYATNTASDGTGAGTTNENVMVIDSTDGGTTWGVPVRISTATTGRRFMPWICPLGGAARVSWYDRRAAVGGGGATNDLTDYFCGSASRGGGGLTAGMEVKVTDSPDAQCAAGQAPKSPNSWPNFVRGVSNSESCSVQPQLAGHCCDDTQKDCPGSQTRCDFSSGPDCASPPCTCPSGETCNGGGGVPKYGDYNGNACWLGRVYNAWASATAPSGESPPGGITVYFDAKLTGDGPDLSVTKSGLPVSVAAGTDLTYTIIVTNNSTIPALKVTMDDSVPTNTTFQSITPLPSGWSCPTVPPVGGTGPISCIANFMAASSTATFTLVVHVPSDTPSGTNISNSVTVASTDPDPNSSNDTGSSSNNVITQADLAVTKSALPDPVIAGTDLTYTISFVNNGPSDALNVSVTDSTPLNTTFQSLTFPLGWSCLTPAVGGTGLITCTKSPVVNGESATFTLVVHVLSSAPDLSTISNATTAASTTTDPTSGNNMGLASTGVITRADLMVTKVDFPDPVFISESDIHYIITVTNAGPSNAANVVLSDPIPTHTNFRSLTSPAGFSCTTPPVGATGTITCTYPSLPPGPTIYTFDVVVQLDHGTPRGTTISDTATVTSDTTDPVPDNNTAKATTLFAVTAPTLSVTALLVCGLLLAAAGMRLRVKGRLSP